MSDTPKNLPELLSPAGNFEKMEAAFRFGADAVYLAGSRFGMRAAADNFNPEELKQAVTLAHQLRKKVYVTLNVMPRQHECRDLELFMDQIGEASPDAVIVADLGVFSLCKKRIPRIPIHISTQAATVNAYGCNTWFEMGAERIVLARELSLREIEAIRLATPKELQLEIFIHGSMCVSFSGRCMLSQYYTGRDANRGECTQPCRWEYHFAENKRPDNVLTGEIYPEGSYIFGSQDLCMIEHIKELIDVGVDSFKIEGRMKSAYYTAVVTNAYRTAMDAIKAGRSLDSALLQKELLSVSHREYCTGYFFDSQMSQCNFASTTGYLGEKTFLATVESYDPNHDFYLCRQKNKFFDHDIVEYITPGKTGQPLTMDGMYLPDGTPISCCQHPQMLFAIRTNAKLKPGDLIRKG